MHTDDRYTLERKSQEAETRRWKAAAAAYAAGGLDACREYLRGLVRSLEINPAAATHILVWTEVYATRKEADA